jgi:threonine/homoserine/homoserine lactone efflux protein
VIYMWQRACNVIQHSRMPRLLPFVSVALLLVITPGPDMAMVTRSAVRLGRYAALLTAAGIETGLFVWTAASVAGLAAVLAASSTAYTVVRLAGAAYLLYLGGRTLLSLRANAPQRAVESSEHSALHRIYKGTPFQQGLVSNLLNPKIAVFFTSFIPQFVEPGPNAVRDSVVLAAIFIGMGAAWLSAYALVATRLSSALRRNRVRRTLDAITGTVLMGLGLRLALERH